MSESHRNSWPVLAVWLLIALYILNFGVLSVLKHAAFQTHTADLGNMDQPIWNTLHGRFLEETKDDGTQGTRLTDHVEPIFALVALSYLLYDGAEAILIFQTLAIAIGALPVFWLARRRLNSGWAGVAFAAIYLLFPALEAANLTEFHAVPLAVAPLLFTFYFFEVDKPLVAWLFALLAMSVKEEISLLTLMLGLYILFFRKQKAHGAALATVSLAWFALATFVIIPRHNTSGNNVYLGRYESMGGSLSGIARTALTQPWRLIQVLNRERLLYVAGLLAGAGFLPLLNPLIFLLSAPILAANVFSDYPAMFSGEFHYSAPIMAFVILAAVNGTGWAIEQAARWRFSKQKVLFALTAWALLCGLGYSYWCGFLPWSRNFEFPQITAHHRLFERFAAQIPPEAILSTTPPLFPHLDHRRIIYLFPVVNDAEYILLDVSGVTDMHPNDVRTAFLELTRGGEFGILDAADGYILLKRGYRGLTTGLPDAFYDFARSQDPKPQYAVQVDFGACLRLRGFDLIDQFRWRLTKVRLYWDVLCKPPEDLRPYPFFLNDSGRIVEDTTLRPMVALLWYPPAQWRVGETLVTETIPWDLGDAFTLAVGVLNGGEWTNVSARLPARVIASDYVIRPFEGGTWVRLLRFERWWGRLRLAAERLQNLPAKIERAVYANLDNRIDCLGADTKVSQDTLQIDLFWQARKPIDKDYTVFVHLLAPGGRMVAQSDSMPQGGMLPTSAWLSGEIVRDSHTLRLDPSLPAGNYQLEVGMYLLANMARLPVLNERGEPAGTSVNLGTVRLGK